VSTRIYGTEADLLSWDWASTLDTQVYGSAGTLIRVQPLTGEVESQYINRVWDAALGNYVRWLTYYIDYTGQEFPGPSTWAAVTASYCVEAIKFGRNVG